MLMRITRKIISFIDKKFVFLFLLSFFLIKIPPLYLFFPIKNVLLTTHSLSRVLIFFLFLVVFAGIFFKRKLITSSGSRNLLVVFVIYFFFQSLSIIGSTNIAAFFQRYKDIVFPGLFLFSALALVVKDNRERIIFTLLLASVFNFFYQILMFLSPEFFKSFAENFVYHGHLELVNINLERARIFIETYDEITIPFLFMIMARQKTRRDRLLVLLLFLLIAIPSLLSNFRSRILMLVFAFFASFVFLAGKKLAIKISLLASFFVVGFLTVSLLNTLFGFSFLDRFALRHEQEDVRPIESRIKSLGRSFEMGIASPVFGVGLGNYYDNLPGQKSITLSLLDWRRKEAQIASTNPHNILAQTFSETGALSLAFYLIFIFYFAVKDFKIIKDERDNYRKAFVISFWTLFSYSMFNPTTTLTYNSLFWFLRSAIAKK